jgi:anti-anti-sigma regulatory factor
LKETVLDAPLKLTGEQTISVAAELHQKLVEYVERGLDILLDLSEVQVCDAAVLQLMCAVRQSANQRKQRFRITAVSTPVAEAAAALGLPLDSLSQPRGAV